MRAARWWQRQDVRVETVDDPVDIPAGWVRIAVEYCGICGTDLEEYRSGPVAIPTAPHPLTGQQAPITLGHEAVGVIDMSAQGTGLPLGTRVAIEGSLSCGKCYQCRHSRRQLCAYFATVGQMLDGGLAEFLMVPESVCVPVDPALDPRRAALAEPLSVAVRAVRTGGVQLGDSVLVIGAGTIGLLTVQAACLAGAGAVAVVEPQPRRQQLALNLGADEALAPGDVWSPAAVLDKGGADVVIECAGRPEAVRAAIAAVRPGGTAVLLGVTSEVVGVDILDIVLREKRVLGCVAHQLDQDFRYAVRLLESGRVDVDPLITQVIGLEDVVARGFGALAQNDELTLKVLVNPRSNAI